MGGIGKQNGNPGKWKINGFQMEWTIQTNEKIYV